MEPVMPATLPLPALFNMRPVYLVTDDEDDRLSNIYWLSTPMGDESDHEQDLVSVCINVNLYGAPFRNSKMCSVC